MNFEIAMRVYHFSFRSQFRSFRSFFFITRFSSSFHSFYNFHISFCIFSSCVGMIFELLGELRIGFRRSQAVSSPAFSQKSQTGELKFPRSNALANTCRDRNDPFSRARAPCLISAKLCLLQNFSTSKSLPSSSDQQPERTTGRILLFLLL